MCSCSNPGVFTNYVPRRVTIKPRNNNGNNVSSKQTLKINFLKQYFEKNNIDMIHFDNALKRISKY